MAFVHARRKRRMLLFCDSHLYVPAGQGDMTNSWLVNAIGLYATTVGALLILLQLLSFRGHGEDLLGPEAKHAYATHMRKLAVAVGLLCLWLVFQDLAVLLL
jgi:hypothetical protein